MEPPTDAVGFGLLGASSIAPEAIVRPLARRTDARAVAVGARRRGAAEVFAAEHGIPAAYDRYEAVLEDPDVQVVYIGLAAADHARWVLAALAAGKHVLCEKPLALDAQEAAELVAAAREHGRILLEAFHYRFHPLVREVRRIVGSPAFGPLRALESVVEGDVPFTPGSILHDPARGGGVLLHSGCYPLHWMRLLTGGEPAVVDAAVRTNALGADTTVTASLRFPGGVEGALLTSFDGVVRGGPQLTVVGERGRLAVTGLISPHRGHSLSVGFDGGPESVTTVAGRASFDHQLEAVLLAVGGDVEAVHDEAGPIGNAAAIDAILRVAGVRDSGAPV